MDLCNTSRGNIVTPLRSRLDPTNVARLVYIHHNSSKVIIQWDLQLELGQLEGPSKSDQHQRAASSGDLDASMNSSMFAASSSRTSTPVKRNSSHSQFEEIDSEDDKDQLNQVSSGSSQSFDDNDDYTSP
nr:uncharacterized protein LOC124808665 [Hydra vulgaris]